MPNKITLEQIAVDDSKLPISEEIKLSKADSKLVAELLVDRPEPTPAMIRAAEHHKRLIGDL